MPFTEGQPHRSGEMPLEFLTRRGFAAIVFAGYYRASKKTKAGTYQQVEGTSIRSLAVNLGWYA